MDIRQRRFNETDVDLLKSWLPDGRAVAQWCGPACPFPLPDAMFKRLVDQGFLAEPSVEAWSLTLGEDDRAVAHYELAFDQRIKEARFGRVIVDPDRRGQGLGHAITALALKRAFARDWVNRVELRVFDFNEPAIRTYRKAGFVHEGTRRQSCPVGEENWNTMIMSMLREERPQADGSQTA